MKRKLEYENLITLVLGGWMMFLPLSVERIDNYPGANVYLWNCFFVGLLVMVMSVLAMKAMISWAETINLWAGIWLLVSPLFLIYYDKSDTLFWNSVVCGALIAFLSALALPIVNNIIYHKHKKEDFSFLENPHRRSRI